ncbi:MAG: redoxin domain-containing protein [Candidatus Bathyarchaeota archaeon]|nr:redoxin domain-containing protein [Candidatus Bathyarchaeota archaeon]
MVRIQIGEEAPDFSIDSVNLGKVILKDFRGRKLLLIFSRYFGCPVCQLEFDELAELLKLHPELKVVYVNQSSSESARKFLEGKDVKFPVISASRIEGKYELYELYGVGKLNPIALLEILQKARVARKSGKVHGTYEGVETQSPANFLLDENGKVLLADYGLFNLEKMLKYLGK